jgi:hypothetical protein
MNKTCENCEHYLDFAYFCVEKNKFIFPEDYIPCEKYNKSKFNGVEREGLRDD